MSTRTLPEETVPHRWWALVGRDDDAPRGLGPAEAAALFAPWLALGSVLFLFLMPLLENGSDGGSQFCGTFVLRTGGQGCTASDTQTTGMAWIAALAAVTTLVLVAVGRRHLGLLLRQLSCAGALATAVIVGVSPLLPRVHHTSHYRLYDASCNLGVDCPSTVVTHSWTTASSGLLALTGALAIPVALVLAALFVRPAPEPAELS